MIVRPAQQSDVDLIVQAAASFVTQTNYASTDSPDAAVLHGTVLGVLESKGGVSAVLASDSGEFLGTFLGLMHENIVSGELLCSEVFFWVAPESRGHGRKLLRYVEDAARDAGCVELVLSAPVSEVRVGKIFEAWGFKPTEIWHRKRVI